MFKKDCAIVYSVKKKKNTSGLPGCWGGGGVDMTPGLGELPSVYKKKKDSKYRSG